MRMLKGGTAGLIAVVLCFATPAVSQVAVTQPPGAPGITAAGAILIDLSDSAVLFRRDAHSTRPPASLTKVVTALVARDQYSMDEEVTTTRKVLDPGGSGLNLDVGMTFTVRDLMYALLIKSANDAGSALAAHHPLGYNHFIRLMNQKARSLGAFESRFVNPHGLDDTGHYSSPWDMAIFARQLMDDPVLADIVAAKQHTMPWKGSTRTYSNHNKLVLRNDAIVGVKTGYTFGAGHCLISAMDTPTGKMLAVVFKSQDHYADTMAMFSYGEALTLTDQQGGGGPDGTTELLAAPPPAPVVDSVDIPSSLPASPDARNDVRWLALMLGLALVTAVTARRRNRDPLREAAAHHSWIEPLVTRRR